MKFSDGVEIKTGGSELRVIRKVDGYYVTGRNLCVPVADWEDGKDLIAALRAAVNDPEVQKLQKLQAGV